jgi:hypothetical protein
LLVFGVIDTFGFSIYKGLAYSSVIYNFAMLLNLCKWPINI